MNLEEFENNCRNAIEQSLNELQTAALLAAELENRIAVIGENLQNISQTVEEFIVEQKAE